MRPAVPTYGRGTKGFGHLFAWDMSREDLYLLGRSSICRSVENQSFSIRFDNCQNIFSTKSSESTMEFVFRHLGRSEGNGSSPIGSENRSLWSSPKNSSDRYRSELGKAVKVCGHVYLLQARQYLMEVNSPKMNRERIKFQTKPKKIKN